MQSIDPSDCREHTSMSLTTLAYVKIALQKRNKIYIRKKVKSKPL